MGVCGTNARSRKATRLGASGQRRLVLGTNRSVARSIPAPSIGLHQGELVVGIVRRPEPRSVPQLRGGEVGHVPQRPVHRARHQGDRRLHVRALAHRARVRDEGRRVAGPARRAARADDVVTKAWEQVDRGRPARRSGSRGPCSSPVRGRSAFWRPWSDGSAGSRCTCSIACESGSKPGDGSCPWGTYHSGHRCGRRLSPDVIVECTGVGQVIEDAVAGIGFWRRDLPHGGRGRRVHGQPARG